MLTLLKRCLSRFCSDYMTSQLRRIGIFYDGTYFARVSNYYMYQHERQARISIEGLHNFVRERVSEIESVDKRFCQVVDAHYFRGRLSAKQAQENDSLYRERQFDDVLIREGVTMHLLPLSMHAGDMQEKGVDVWFALESYELATLKRFDISVLITGDGDFVPLVRKLNTLGTRVMLLAWDFEYQDQQGIRRVTRASQGLINEVTYPVMMSTEIDDRSKSRSPLINQLFIPKAREVMPPSTATPVTPLPTGQSSGQGVIDNFNSERGFGFIRPDDGSANLFFHFSSVSPELMESGVVPGIAVTFQRTMGDRGPVAVDIEAK